MSSCHGARKILQHYITALAERDLLTIDQMTSEHSLIENPFLKPNRLFGKAEILKAHVEIFANLETVEINLAKTESNERHAIAEGRLDVTRHDKSKQRFQVGIVVESAAGELTRVSLYCDARNIRQWSDKTIL